MIKKESRNGIDYYARESDAAEGFSVRVPAGYTPGKLYPVWVIVHGIGERSSGTIDDLQNVREGYDYDGPGPLLRQYGIETTELKANGDRFGHITVIVTYPSEFNPNDFDYVLDFLEQNYQVDTSREAIIGFSLGGGAILRYITSSLKAAQRVAVAVACAPVNWAGNVQNIVDARLQLIATSAAADYRVNPTTNIKPVLDRINALKPSIAPVYIEWPGTGHGTFNEMLAGTDSRIPQSMFAYLDASTSITRLKYPTTGTKPTTPPVTQPTTATADFNIAEGQVITTKIFELDASASKNATSFFWDVQRDDTSGKGVSWTGGVLGGPKKVISGLTDGKYVAQLVVNNNVPSGKRKFTVKLDGSTTPEPTPKKVISLNASKVVFSDGSTEDAAGWKLVSKSGTTYDL